MSKTLFLTLTAAMIIMAVSCGQKQSAAIKFETISLENFEKHPKGKAAKDGFSYKINFSYPAAYSDKAVLKKLQNKLVLYTLGEEYVAMINGNNAVTLEKAADARIAALRQAYYSHIEELQACNSDPNFVTGWHVECSNDILFMNETLLQLQTKNGLYPTEAHVFENVSCCLFNLQTGDEYSRNDIFKPDAAESIRGLIIPELLKKWNIKSLDEWGIERNRIWSQETQFAITPEGMFIAHNDDNLGLYSVTIPYAKILPCLREGTPIWEAVKKIEK